MFSPPSTFGLNHRFHVSLGSRNRANANRLNLDLNLGFSRPPKNRSSLQPNQNPFIFCGLTAIGSQKHQVLEENASLYP